MILVTGGTGLVGAHLLYDLLKAGKQIRALKRRSSNTEEVRRVFSYYTNKADELFERIEWIEGNMLDVFSLEKALKGVVEVYHSAALVSFIPGDRKRMQEINVEGTRNLVNLCLENSVRKFCFVSSVAALGDPGKGETIVSETTTWNPKDNRSAYSLSKFRSELEVWRGINEGLKTVIVNPSIILGPGFWNKGSSRLFSMVDRRLKYFTRGVTGYVDVRDVSRAMIELMESNVKNERFIVNSENCSYEFIFKQIAQQMRITPPVKYASPFMTEIGWRLAYLGKIFFLSNSEFSKETARASHNIKHFSNQKIKKALNFEFIPVKQSIKDVVAHYPKIS